MGLQDRPRPHFGHYFDLDERRVAADAVVGADPVDLHFDPAAKAETVACCRGVGPALVFAIASGSAAADTCPDGLVA